MEIASGSARRLGCSAGLEASAWYGVGAPKGTPADIVDSSTRRLMRSSLTQGESTICRPGAALVTGTAADFGKLLADNRKVGKVVKFAGLKPE